MIGQRFLAFLSFLQSAFLAATLVFVWPSPASACDFEYCSVDLNFAARAYAGCDQLSDCVRVSRGTGKWAQWRDGHLSYFGPDNPAITDEGLLIEPDSENYLRFSRDLSTDAWKKTGMATAPTTSGVDAATNSATTLTALDADAVVSQAVKLETGPLTFSLYLRRRAGAGPVDISYDGGASWLRCAVRVVFTRCATSLDQLKNPQAAIRLEAKGDAVDVDFVQMERQRFATSPITTKDEAPVRRAADEVALLGNAAAPLQSGVFTLMVEGGGAPPRERAVEHVEVIGGSNASLFFTPRMAGYVRGQTSSSSSGAFAELGWDGSLLLGRGSMAKPFRIAASSDAELGASFCADAGEVTRMPAFATSDQPWRLGGGGAYGGFIRRLTIWDKKMEDSRLRAVSRIEVRHARIFDIDRKWANYTVRDLLTLNDVKYETQGGIHFDRFTHTYPLQVADGGDLKFNLFPGNTWAIDSPDPDRGSERVELSGNPYASLARFPGPKSDSIWISDAFYLEKGDPLTTDWLMVGQIHDRVGLGPVFSMNIHCCDFMSVDLVTKNLSEALGRLPFERGRWYRRVVNLKFDPSGEGLVKVWIDGKQIVDYKGVTGNPDTQYYYWKFGLYRSHAPEYTAAHYANIRVGGEELKAKIDAPDPLPTVFCSKNGSC